MTSPMTSSMNKKSAASKLPAAFTHSSGSTSTTTASCASPVFSSPSTGSFLRLPLTAAATMGLLSNTVDRPDVLQSLAAQTTTNASTLSSGSSAALPPHPHGHPHGHIHATKLKTGGKKTKGRVKIKMEFIDNKLRRYTTFSKRKAGLMKKVRVVLPYAQFLPQLYSAKFCL